MFVCLCAHAFASRPVFTAKDKSQEEQDMLQGIFDKVRMLGKLSGLRRTLSPKPKAVNPRPHSPVESQDFETTPEEECSPCPDLAPQATRGSVVRESSVRKPLESWLLQ